MHTDRPLVTRALETRMEMEAEVFGLITDIIHAAVLVAGGRALETVSPGPSS